MTVVLLTAWILISAEHSPAQGGVTFHATAAQWTAALYCAPTTAFPFTASNVALASEVSLPPSCTAAPISYGRWLTFNRAATGLATDFVFDASPPGNSACYLCNPERIGACGDTEHDWSFSFGGGAPVFGVALWGLSGALNQYTLIVRGPGGATLASQALASSGSFVGVVSDQPITTLFMDDTSSPGGVVVEGITFATDNGLRSVSPGCGTSTITACGNAVLGGSVSFQLGALQGLGFMVLGFTPGSQPVCTGCTVGMGPGVSTEFTSTYMVFVPPNPALRGTRLYCQGLDLLAAGGCLQPMPLTLTQTIRLTVQ